MSSHRRETAITQWIARLRESAPGRKVLVPVAVAILALVAGTVAAIAQIGDSGGEPEATRSATTVTAATPEQVTTTHTPEPPTIKTAKPGKKKNLLVELAEELAKKNPGAPPAVFRPATLNLLGDSHTRRGGNKKGFRSGAARMAGAVSVLRSQQVDVVALQEFEPAQKGAFARHTGAGWSVFTGSAKGRDSVAWRTEVWEFVSGGTRQMPYFRGQRIPFPYVLLEHKATGRQVYFISMHNPVSNKRRGNNQHWRNVATSIQVNLVKELSADGTPVLLMGDFNERQEAFCRVAGAGLIAANGGTGAPCRPPAKAGIDWIFGTANLTFNDYARVDGGVMNRITDHPLIVATAVFDQPAKIEPLPPETVEPEDE